MQRQVNIHEAKTHLSRLIQSAAEGEDIIIAKAGKPMACLTAYQPVVGVRKPGRWRNRVKIKDDFDSLPADIEAAFRGEAD